MGVEMSLGLEDLKRQAAENAKIEACKRVNDVVNRCGNSELAKAVLQHIKDGCQSRDYLNCIALHLGVPQKETDGIVAYFSEIGMVYIERHDRPSWSQLPNIDNAMIIPQFNDAVKAYFESDLPYGPRQLLERKDLSSKVAQKAMSVISNDVIFDYSRTFELPLETLEVLRERSHEALSGIREGERKFLVERLGIPANFDTRYLTFVGEKDPTTYEGGGRIREFSFGGSFQSVDDAFTTGFSYARGFVNIDADKKGTVIWPFIEVHNSGLVCDIEMTNPTISAIKNGGSFAAQQEVRRKVPEILKKVTAIIS